MREETIDVEVVGLALHRDPPAPFIFPSVPTSADGTESVLKHELMLSEEKALIIQTVQPEEVGAEPNV